MSDFNSIIETMNTDLVRIVANNLKNLNCQIRDEFEAVKSVVSDLKTSWQGNAADHTIGNFDKIKELSEKRYDVIDTYVNYLLAYIGEGHEENEEKNTSLVDMFK